LVVPRQPDSPPPHRSRLRPRPPSRCQAPLRWAARRRLSQLPPPRHRRRSQRPPNRPLRRSRRWPRRRSPLRKRRHHLPRSRRRSRPRRRRRGCLDPRPRGRLLPPTPGPLPLSNRPHRPTVQAIEPRSPTEGPRRGPTEPLGSTSARRVASHSPRPSLPKGNPRRTDPLLRPCLQAGSADLPGLPNGSRRLLPRGLRKRRSRPRRRNHHASPQRQPVRPRQPQRMRPGRRPAPSQPRAPPAPRRPRTHLCRPPRPPRRRTSNLRIPSGQATRTSGAAGPGTCAASSHRGGQRNPRRRHRREAPRSARTSTASANRSRA